MKLEEKEEMLYRAPLGILGVFIFVLGILAFPGLAALSDIGANNAGQGVEVVDGFTVSNVGYDATPSENDPDAMVLEVSFNIVRGGDNRLPVSYSNAGVFVQLRSATEILEWGKCFVLDGFAECRLEDRSQMEVADITGLSVVAYDSEADNIPFIATGGDTVYEITVNGIEYRVHEFTTTGTQSFEVTSVPLGGRIDYLVVAGGGGGGGGFAGGGGGAGGAKQSVYNPSQGSYSITVGAGGAGSAATGASGSNSSAFGVTAPGGGGGNGRFGNGVSGGSGGGAGWDASVPELFGGDGTPGFGFAGGNSRSSGGSSRGGGGGGATSVGQNYGDTSAGNGGNGLSTNISGSARCFAGGGGGAAESGSHTNGIGVCGGGNGGGGNGSGSTAGAANTGGGGGGAVGSFSAGSSPGGSGTVILRYRIS